MRKLALLAAPIALVVVACGGNEPAVTKQADTTTTTAAESQAKDGEAVRAYFEAFASGDAERMRAEMLPVSAPGSAAALYAIHQAAVAESLAAGGVPGIEESVTFSDDKVTSCFKNPISQEDEDCGDFTNFIVNDAGLLTDFDSNGQTVSSRLGKSDSSEAVAMGATVKFVSAYKAGSNDDLVIVVEVAAGPTETTVGNYSASYVGGDGKQLTASTSTGPSDLKPGARAYYGMVFSGGDLGGTVSVEVFDADYNAAAAAFPIVPAF